MTSKEIFLEINKEILLKSSKTISYSSKEEERILNYRNGIRFIILNESQFREIEFFSGLQEMYLKTQIPLLTAHTSLLLHRKFLISKDIFKSLIYLANKLKKKSFISELLFWELVIVNFSFNDKVTFISEKPKLDLFIQISSQLFLIHSYEIFQLIFCYTLNYRRETVNFCWSTRQMGNSIPSYLLSKSPVTPFIWKTYSFLKEMNAPYQVYEVIFFQYHNLKNDSYNCFEDEEYHSFFQFLYRHIPIATIQRESILSNTKLFEIYKLNPTIFELIDLKQVNEEYQKILNASPWSSTRLGEFSAFLVEKMLKEYGISVYFAKAYAVNSINENEKIWFNDVLSGKNLIYSANLPFKLSKKVAHEFNTQSYHPAQRQSAISVTKALIRTALFTEVKDMDFATIISGKIRDSSESDFWIKTMSLLYHKGLRADTIHLNELYDYIHYQMYELGRRINFTTKKLPNLIDESYQWHDNLNFTKQIKRLRLKLLPDFNIKPYFLQRKNCRYVIKQLKTNLELYNESVQLQHCVYTYTYDCLNSGSYIFSLREIIKNESTKESKEVRIITIEVNNKRIEQKLGKLNRACSQLENDLIEEWGKFHHLT